MKNIFERILNSIFGGGKAWWIEVKTGEPACTYYFGPFEASEEAELAKQGYVEDLEKEGAKQVQATVMYCQEPQQLTVDNNSPAGVSPKSEPALTGGVQKTL